MRLTKTQLSERHAIVMHKSQRSKTIFNIRLSGFLESFDGLEDFINMAWNFESTPFILKTSVGTDQECASFNALDLFAVHDFVF